MFKDLSVNAVGGRRGINRILLLKNSDIHKNNSAYKIDIYRRYNRWYIYRVSIKSFPDYKHLFKENYVEYNFFFQNVTQLKKFFYNTSVHFNMCCFCCTQKV